ncbi:retrovirus-related Pol polyprotein from transposon 412 [Trichonephila clavipes]|nr:retrovirus-related Pol polyprotein from transposon 412 [Trichonephila clavipes]
MYTLLSFHHLLIITRPGLFSDRPCIRETNNCRNDQQFCDRMPQLSTPIKEHKQIIQYSNLIEHIIPNSDYDIINVIIDKYKHAFAKNKFDVDELKCNSPKIILTSELPIANQPYRTSFKEDTEIKKQLDALLRAGIIKPSYSSYAAPITLAFKKDDNARTRLCIDYRKLNAITKLDAEPIPRIDAVLDKLTHAKFFSTIDLCTGYCHIKLDDNESEKLAFTLNYGLFHFNRLPF